MTIKEIWALEELQSQASLEGHFAGKVYEGNRTPENKANMQAKSLLYRAAIKAVKDAREEYYAS